MQAPSSSSALFLAAENDGANGYYVQMENNGTEEESALDLLSKGEDIFIRMDTKTMLCKVLVALDAKAEIVFNEIDCGRRAVRFAIKIKASVLTQEPAETTRYSIHLGEPSDDINSAKNSAAAKAFKYMEENSHIKVVDFSSRLIARYGRNNTYHILFSATDSLEKIMFEWDVSLGKCEEMTKFLLEKQKEEFFLGTLSHIGEVYRAVANPLNAILVELNPRTDEAHTKIGDVEEQKEILANKRIQLGQRHVNLAGHRESQLGSKHVLNYLLNFFGLAIASYINEPLADGMVHSSVSFCIPCMAIHKYGGNIKLTGKGKNCHEAEELAAFEALMFIENNFKIQIADYNYMHRKEFTKYEERSVEILKTIVDIADEVKLMWGRFDNVIEAQNSLLQYDPTSLFPGSSSEGQLHAFKVSADAIAQVMKVSSDAYKSCSRHFESLYKLRWTVVTNKFWLPC